jgi:hypothetical protein
MSKPKDLWFEDNGERHRVVAIEYQDGHPASVVTEEHWDHTGKPWFQPGRDTPTGISASYWNFDWSRTSGTLYYHLSGAGGEPRYHVARFCEPSPPKAELWVAEGCPIAEYSLTDGEHAPVIDSELLARGYKRIALPKLLENRHGEKTRNPFVAGEQADTVYCDECRDYLPAEHTYHPCQHIEWCDECVAWIYSESRKRVECSMSTCDCQPEGEEDD